MTKAFVAATQALQQHCRRFDASGLEAKSAALAQVAAAPLPLSAALIGHHEALLFLRAHPSSAAMLRQVEAELARLTKFLHAQRGQHPEALQNHGLPFVDTATRYLRGITLRLQRQSVDPQKDLQKATAIMPLWQSFVTREAELRAKGRTREELDGFAWLVEEARISIFAPELKTAVPISIPRRTDLWKALSR